MGMISNTVSNSITGVGSIIGKAIATRGLKKEADRRQREADRLFAETKDKPEYSLGEETLGRLDYYKNEAQSGGFRFGALGQETERGFSRRVQGLQEGATSGAQLLAGVSGASSMAGDSRRRAVNAGAQDIQRADAGVDRYTSEVERENEINWGVKLGDVLRKEQLAYDYLGGSNDARTQRLYAISQMGASGTQAAAGGYSAIADAWKGRGGGGAENTVGAGTQFYGRMKGTVEGFGNLLDSSWTK